MRIGWVEEAKGRFNISGNAQLIIGSGEESPAAILLGDFNNGADTTPSNRPT